MNQRFSRTEPSKSSLPDTVLDGSCKESFDPDSLCPGDYVMSGGMGRQARTVGSAAALLDIYTPSRTAKRENTDVPLPFPRWAALRKLDCVRRSENSRWNRATLGMMMPGVTWFLTLTTSPQSSRPIKKDYQIFWRKWWKTGFPGVENCWVETDEGLGVIHALIRLPRDCEFPTQPVIQNAWQVQHQAFSTWSKVSHEGKMANYQRQRQKESAAGEMKKQTNVLAWDYSRGWLPPGFLKVWGPVWRDTIIRVPRVEQSRVITDWIQAVNINPENLYHPPVYEDNLIMEYYVS